MPAPLTVLQLLTQVVVKCNQTVSKKRSEQNKNIVFSVTQSVVY